MKYFRCYKESGAEPREVPRDEARRLLEGWWKKKSLDDIFDNGKCFRLYTPYVEVWTDDNGKIPMVGFYGIVG